MPTFNLLPFSAPLATLGALLAGTPPRPTAVLAADIDLTPKQGLTIGGVLVPWGTAAHLHPSQAFAKSRGKCAFRVGYDVVNGGADSTPAFDNTLSLGAAVVDTKSALHLAGQQSATFGAQAWLAPGTIDLILRLDAGQAVAETNELNNTVRVRVTLDGQCMGPAGASAGPGGAGGRPGPKDVEAVSRDAADATYGVPDTKSGVGGIIINDCQATMVRRLGGAAAGIIAQCDGSVMTLRGQVPTPEAKAAAEQAARSVPGVTRVNNLLTLDHERL
jgi:hypothetical protein